MPPPSRGSFRPAPNQNFTDPCRHRRHRRHGRPKRRVQQSSNLAQCPHLVRLAHHPGLGLATLLQTRHQRRTRRRRRALNGLRHLSRRAPSKPSSPGSKPSPKPRATTWVPACSIPASSAPPPANPSRFDPFGRKINILPKKAQKGGQNPRFQPVLARFRVSFRLRKNQFLPLGKKSG